MKVELWYLDAGSDVRPETTSPMVTLKVGDDGRAQLILEDGSVRDFSSEEEASVWLVDEEYRRYADFLEDLGPRFLERASDTAHPTTTSGTAET